jgi:two-component system chemotaxis response regulator CheB
MSPIRVLVIDDSQFIRTVIQDMLKKDPAIEVVDTAADGIEGMKKILEHSPDAVTLDIEMPRMNGLELLGKLTLLDHPPKVLVLSSLTSQGAEMTRLALREGADDFMLKPKGIITVRGIEKELAVKIKNLVRIPVSVVTTPRKREMAQRIVLIGSSAGGPPMLDAILSSLDPHLPAAVLITQHMPLGFTAPLADRLNKISSLPVKESENGDLLEKGQVLVSKAGFHTIVTGTITAEGMKGGRLIHSTEPPVHSVRPAVDKTFTSGAKAFGGKAVGVLLSGMGKDGGEGCQEIQNSGGTIIVCAEEECLVYGMIRSALERGCVDEVVALNQMSEEIEKAVARAEG